MKHFFNQNYKWKLYKQRFAVYFWLTVGAFLMALAVTVYFDRLELVTGGVTGLAIILRHLFHIPMWLVNVATNIPIFIIMQFSRYTRLVQAYCSEKMRPFPYIQEDGKGRQIGVISTLMDGGQRWKQN